MHCRKLLAVAALVSACDPSIKQVANQSFAVTARFDPAQDPPVVPTPNDLATDPKTALLNVPVPPGASEADQQFIAYLNTLDGYPTSVTGNETFSGTLTSSSVNATNVRVYDVTATPMKITAGTPVYADAMDGGSSISIPPPVGGWTPAHTYAIAMLGGTNGLKDSSGNTVVASPTWALLRSKGSLVTCTDLTSSDCASVTALIPTAAQAVQLEQLRLKYAPIVDHVVMEGFQRTDIVILWTFKIVSFPQVAFAPPTTVPLPNDLAIDPVTHKVVVPVPANASAAYQELIHDYLDMLDGFPASSTATVGIVGGTVDPASATPANVLASSLNGMMLSGTPGVSFDATSMTLSIAPPNGTWGKGDEIGIAVLGGKAGSGITQPGGAPVVASPEWVFVRGTAPLVTCTIDCTNPAQPGIPAGCASTVTTAPLNIDQAAGLECLRELYAPALDALAAKGVPRTAVNILWTFRTVSFPEATFDPQHNIIPFPNDLLRTTTAPIHLNLPVPDGGSMLLQQLITGLNTLDGFSLTAPIVSETSAALGPIDTGLLDPATLDGGTAFIKLGAVQGTLDVAVCLNCASSPLPDGGAQTSPQQLQFVPRVPLTEQTPYAAWMTDDLKDTDGKPVIASVTFAILRLRNVVCDANHKSTLPIVTDAQACAPGGLEDARHKTNALLGATVDPIDPQRRKHVSLAWSFTTQTTLTELANLHDAVPTMGPASTPPSVFPVPTAMVAPMGLPVSALAMNVYMGTVLLPFALTGPGGTMRTPNAWQIQKTTFLLTVPAGPAPMGGWPVVLYGHGLGSTHLQMIAIANTLAAAGQATIAVDAVWHGDRNTCAGSAIALQAMHPGATDDDACADPMTQKCNETTGRCVAKASPTKPCTVDAECIPFGLGFCNTTSCEGGDFARNASGTPLINSWNFLNLENLFAARDNFRHYPLDLAQLVKVMKDTSMTGLSAQVQAVGGPALDGTHLNYVGVSLGGFHGALFGAVDKNVTNVALNVPGSDQTTVLLVSPAFADQRNGFLATLAATGIEPGTPDFDSFLVFSKTIFDPADPQNFGLTAVNPGQVPGRKVFMQWIQDDFVVPNVTTDELIAASSTGANMPLLEKVNPSFATLMPPDRHGFLLNFKDPTTTITAQTHIAHFIVTGSPQ
jgi:hypothetical protein